jgi:hypothetical protein
MPQCTAKSKRSQQQCRHYASRGHIVCHLHGGKTPRGFGLPQCKTGKYSKVLPLRLAQRYGEALTNPQLLSLKDDVAAAEARLVDLFSRIDTGESGQLWQGLREAADAFEAALGAGDAIAIDRHWATIQRLVTQGSNDYQAWSEVYKVWETRCKLTQQETRMLLTQQQMVSVEQLTHMFSAITAAIQRSVVAHADEDVGRRILAAISQEFDWIADKVGEA